MSKSSRPKFEESRQFFIDVMGMTQSGEKGDSVYLRGWDDYERYSLKLTASKTSGLGHAAFRTRSPQALERRAAALKGSGFDIGWSDGDLGHGKTFVFKDPDGHKFEIYYETEWYDPPPELKPALKNQAAEISCARNQCAPDRPFQRARGRYQSQPRVLPELSWFHADRADCAR